MARKRRSERSGELRRLWRNIGADLVSCNDRLSFFVHDLYCTLMFLRSLVSGDCLSCEVAVLFGGARWRCRNFGLWPGLYLLRYCTFVFETGFGPRTLKCITCDDLPTSASV